MTAKRSDGIDEEPFDLDDDDDAYEAPPRKRRGSKYGARQTEQYEGEYPPEDDEFAEGEDEFDDQPAGVLGGLPPQTVKLIAGAVIALAVIGIVAAMALRSSSKEKDAKRREQEFLRKGVSLTYEAAKMAVEYFSSDPQTVPPEFFTRFHEDRMIVDVVIQQQPSGSVTFHPVAFALKRKVDRLGERPKYNPQPIPGTEVFDTKGTAVVNMVEYPIRVFRQNINDDKGRVRGRVAVMLFEPGRTD